MPIFALNEQPTFPPVELADENGILAVGGDLTTERLTEAYTHGIFPWFSRGDPIIWWSPDPRFVLSPDSIKISKSMKQVLRKNIFKITYDTNFEGVITGCRKPRKKEKDTWITDEMFNAYCMMHEIGLAHSVEAWKDDKLAGGLYGISLGKCFFGESMFAEKSNASKAAFITLAKKLQQLNFVIIDCQVYTDHLDNLGAKEIPRSDFIDILNIGLQHKTLQGNWNDMSEFKISAT